MSIVSALARTSQRVARSTSRRPSISISSWVCAAILLSSSSTAVQNERISNTSRATANARASCDVVAPVSSASRNANVVPARSTSWLATTVAMISRRSRCACICARVALGQRVGEVALEVAQQVGVFGQVGVEQLLEQVDLAVRDQGRQLGRDQAQVGRLALGDRPVARERLELAIEPGVLLELRDQTRVHVDHLGRLGEREAHRLGLRVAGVQDPLGDRVGHLHQQRIALVAGHQPVGDRRAQEDLDVDLVVGGVDARHVVDRVGVDPPAARRRDRRESRTRSAPPA